MASADGFVFDTNVYITAWVAHYPPSVTLFQPIWEVVERAMDEGRIVSPRAVLNELTRKDDEVSAWAKRRAVCFPDLDEAEQRLIARVYQAAPGLIKLNNPRRNEADPFVVAMALGRRFPVVTYEGMPGLGGPGRKAGVQIPDACASLGVGCISLPEALRQLGG